MQLNKDKSLAVTEDLSPPYAVTFKLYATKSSYTVNNYIDHINQ